MRLLERLLALMAVLTLAASAVGAAQVADHPRLASFDPFEPEAQLDPVIQLEVAVSGLVRPVAIAHAGDTRLFVAQQGGRIVIVENGVVRAQPFLDLTALVSSGGEQGLLGLAFDPDYSRNGFFYVNYTDRSGDTIVARYSVSPSDPNRADPGSAVTVLFVDQPFANHNGGQLQFGPDRMLYIGLGDGGSGGDPGNRAQNRGTLLGKLLRIDVSGAVPYAIPSDNPFIGQAGVRPEIWAFGLRNPWRFTFDRTTGDLWIADVGQGEWEEINFQHASSFSGENYGWKPMEGTHCFSPATNCNDGTFVLPVVEYGHSGGACSVTGGYVYRGARSPRLNGTYIYGDFCNGVIWGARRTAGGAVQSSVLIDSGLLISTFGEDLNGELLVADYNGGRLLRIVDTRPIGPRRRAVRH